jgi:hypothetical protein
MLVTACQTLPFSKKKKACRQLLIVGQKSGIVWCAVLVVSS